jgi:hypothetical protein
MSCCRVKCAGGSVSRTSIGCFWSCFAADFCQILKNLAIVQLVPAIRWHRASLRCYWRWKSRARGGRPTIRAKMHRTFVQFTVLGTLRHTLFSAGFIAIMCRFRFLVRTPCELI